jgi:hypothetical protein
LTCLKTEDRQQKHAVSIRFKWKDYLQQRSLTRGISPFGTKKQLQVYVEESILSLPKIFINAGRRVF